MHVLQSTAVSPLLESASGDPFQQKYSKALGGRPYANLTPTPRPHELCSTKQDTDDLLLCGSEDATCSTAKEQDFPPSLSCLSDLKSPHDSHHNKPEINWVQLGREVYARYWEVRSSMHIDAASIIGTEDIDALETRRSTTDANAAHIIEEILSRYTLVPPSGSTDVLPSSCASIGSLLHDAGICKPCVFANKNAKTCRNQMMCYFCHHPHKERRKKRYTFRNITPETESPTSPDQHRVPLTERQRHTACWRTDMSTSADSFSRGVPSLSASSSSSAAPDKRGAAQATPRADSSMSTAPSTNRDNTGRRGIDRTKKGSGKLHLQWPPARDATHQKQPCKTHRSKGDASPRGSPLFPRFGSPTIQSARLPSKRDEMHYSATSSPSSNPSFPPEVSVLNDYHRVIPEEGPSQSEGPQNRDAIIAALLLSQAVDAPPPPLNDFYHLPAMPYNLPTLNLALLHERQDVVPLSSRAPMDHAEFWPQQSTVWPSPASSREDYPSSSNFPELNGTAAQCVDSFIDDSWWEQEMLGTLLSSLLVSPNTNVRADETTTNECWRSNNVFCQVPHQ
eukprot:Blabericola_migrator_1__6548@NODE_32_length_18281_cov_109_908422_g28_i0_p3_GENE_NODE_32_length_18281_cov_109_908422_g28_i0NODE_32_length_18281_cov_109_908422_g28_i0_p3_ORF_typecomplete_len565_score71_15zfP11/PF03854_14/0_37_NODE_32_length_18281_cov_109_908422_g28_i02181912